MWPPVRPNLIPPLIMRRSCCGMTGCRQSRRIHSGSVWKKLRALCLRSQPSPPGSGGNASCDPCVSIVVEGGQPVRAGCGPGWAGSGVTGILSALFASLRGESVGGRPGPMPRRADGKGLQPADRSGRRVGDFAGVCHRVERMRSEVRFLCLGSGELGSVGG